MSTSFNKVKIRATKDLVIYLVVYGTKSHLFRCQTRDIEHTISSCCFCSIYFTNYDSGRVPANVT